MSNDCPFSNELFQLDQKDLDKTLSGIPRRAKWPEGAFPGQTAFANAIGALSLANAARVTLTSP